MKLRLFLIAMMIIGCQESTIHPQGEHPTIEQELEIFDAPLLEPGVVGSPAQDLRHEFAAKYEAARKLKLQHQASCEACGKSPAQLATIGGHLETHHVISVERIYNENLDDGLISDPANLIVLCRGGKSSECHFNIGHDPDGPWKPLTPSWRVSNTNVRRDAAKIMQNGGKF